ncbi:hypothetical protein TNCV_5046971 [Trichonephila clavipes]|nr:hypothetical protein TNCV_5046971 [Trichonephila clavipes]
MKTRSRLSPNKNTPIIAFEAKARVFRKENSPHLIIRGLDMLTCPPIALPPLAERECVENSWSLCIKTTFVKPSSPASS